MKIYTNEKPSQRPAVNSYTRVADAPLDVKVKYWFGLHRSFTASEIENMTISEAQANYDKTCSRSSAGGMIQRGIEDDPAASIANERIKNLLKVIGLSQQTWSEINNLPFVLPSRQTILTPTIPQTGGNDKNREVKEESRIGNVVKTQIIPKMKKRLFTDSIIRSLNKGKLDPFEDYYHDLSKENFKKSKLDHLLSAESITLMLDTIENRAALTVGSMGAESHPLIRLEDYAPIISQLGINYVTSMLTTKNLSVLSGDTPASIAENGENEDGAGSIEKISFAPLRISYTQPVSRLLILQGGPAFDELLIKLLMNGLTNQMLSTLFGVLERTAIRPQGAFFAITSGQTTAAAAAVPTFNSILSMEEALDSYPVGKRAYLTSTAGRRILARTQKEVGFPDSLLDGEGRMNGWPCYVSNAVSQAAGSDAAGTGLMFGNWDELTLCQFGNGFIVDVDPYSKAKSNTVLITISGFYDWKSLRGTVSTGSTEANEFKGFSTLAIK